MCGDMITRILHIDSPVPATEGFHRFDIKTMDHLREFLEDVSSFDEEPLSLNVQGCSAPVFGGLLKFVEDYNGSIEMMANDPVPPTMISRFARVCVFGKTFPEETMVELIWRYKPVQLVIRLRELFGIPKKESLYGH